MVSFCWFCSQTSDGFGPGRGFGRGMGGRMMGGRGFGDSLILYSLFITLNSDSSVISAVLLFKFFFWNVLFFGCGGSCRLVINDYALCETKFIFFYFLRSRWAGAEDTSTGLCMSQV